LNLEKVLKVSKAIAIEAGEKIMEIYNRDFEISYKENDSPLTEADEAADLIIKTGLRKYFPEAAILSEEGKDNLSRLDNIWCFVIDPLDGTKEFIKKNGEFTVNIALAYKNKVVTGVIYVPVKKVLYYAAEGLGSKKDLLEEKKTIELKVTDKLDKLVLVGSKSHASEKLTTLIEVKKDLISDTMSAGSSLKGCLVAEGSADVYYRFGYTCEWDTAAMHAIVEQAGGLFMQMNNTPMTYNRTNNLNEKGFYVVNRKENIWV